MANILSDEYWEKLYNLIVNNNHSEIRKEMEELEKSMVGKKEADREYKQPQSESPL